LASVARLATVRPDGAPHLVPITFAIAKETLVHAVDFKPKRRPNLQRLENLRANPAVSILVDEYTDDWSALWWVRVDGTAEIVEDGPRFRDAIEALVAKYPQYRDNVPEGPVIVVRPAGWRAWRFRATSDG
jgi:PPOX class probable F420-dependent enzyme